MTRNGFNCLKWIIPSFYIVRNQFKKRFDSIFPIFPPKQHNFHEVADKTDYQEYMKRMLNDDRVVAVKRNFDEIDRFGLNRFVQSSPPHASWNKRNFDEIDRLVPQVFTDNKREEGSNDGRSGKYVKFV